MVMLGTAVVEPLPGRIKDGIAPAMIRSWLLPHGDGALSSNVGAADLAFQRWFRFKEAYSPRLVMESLQDNRRPTSRCIDPTGGSGTTGLVCSFLGIDCDTIEVSPFMADLILAKTSRYDVRSLAADLARVLSVRRNGTPPGWLSAAPPTLVEPGDDGRWVFGRVVAEQIHAFSAAIEIAAPANQPFLRVMLGSILRDVSNVVVNGKGRRYRRRWQGRSVSAVDVVDRMRAACNEAFADVVRFSGRLKGQVSVHRGDARTLVADMPSADCAIFSPPYPNSFDYTDIYNLELWMLGYLRTAADNRDLRLATMHSHVQLNRAGRVPRCRSPILDSTLDAIGAVSLQLWHRGIPSMLNSYFADLENLLSDLAGRIRTGGSIVVVIGGSSYGGVAVDAPSILAELGRELGLEFVRHTRLRQMRLSSQQGGQPGLSEDIVEFRT